jgi:hypothetical protein
MQNEQNLKSSPRDSIASCSSADTDAPSSSDKEEPETETPQGVTKKKAKLHHASTVTFNVGGKIHEVSRSFLELNEGTLLCCLASDRWSTTNGETEESQSPLFIDRDGERFSFVLDFLRHGKVALPFTVTKESLLLDLDFYGIQVADRSKVEYAASPSAFSCLQRIKDEEQLLYCLSNKLQIRRSILEKRKTSMGMATFCFNSLVTKYPHLVLNDFSADMADGVTVSKSQVTKFLKSLIGVHEVDDETREWFNECLRVYSLKLKSISLTSSGKPKECNKYNVEFEAVA